MDLPSQAEFMDSLHPVTPRTAFHLRDEDCAVCQDPFTNPVRLRCGHFFCEECTRCWLKSSNAATCPMCRTRLYRYDIFAWRNSDGKAHSVLDWLDEMDTDEAWDRILDDWTCVERSYYTTEEKEAFMNRALRRGGLEPILATWRQHPARLWLSPYGLEVRYDRLAIATTHAKRAFRGWLGLMKPPEGQERYLVVRRDTLLEPMIAAAQILAWDTTGDPEQGPTRFDAMEREDWRRMIIQLWWHMEAWEGEIMSQWDFVECMKDRMWEVHTGEDWIESAMEELCCYLMVFMETATNTEIEKRVSMRNMAYGRDWDFEASYEWVRNRNWELRCSESYGNLLPSTRAVN